MHFALKTPIAIEQKTAGHRCQEAALGLYRFWAVLLILLRTAGSGYLKKNSHERTIVSD